MIDLTEIDRLRRSETGSVKAMAQGPLFPHPHSAIRELVCKSRLSVQELENANLEANLPNWEFCELTWVLLGGSNLFLLCLERF